MKIIFGTTNMEKLEDINNILVDKNLNLQVLTLKDIGWDLGEIEANGSTIEENSFIKAHAIHKFCVDHNIDYPIVTEDSGLFVYSLGLEPGVYTARYADSELALDSSLPKHQCIYKLFNRLNGKERKACYRSVITLMYPNGDYIQEDGMSEGIIDTKINGNIQKPYFYTVFLYNGKPFNSLTNEELKETYRYQALVPILTKINLEQYGRIVNAALLKNDCIYVGSAHHKIFPLEPIGILRSAKQGFVTEKGYFVDRKLGLEIAEYYNQVDYKHNPLDRLNSEDLKKDNLKVLTYLKDYSYKGKM